MFSKDELFLIEKKGEEGMAIEELNLANVYLSHLHCVLARTASTLRYLLRIKKRR